MGQNNSAAGANGSQKSDDKKKHRKRDLALVVIVLAVAAAGFLVNQNRHKEPAVMVEVSVDGKVVESLDLAKDADIEVKGYQEGTNHLIIKDGEVWIEDATCPDKVCIHQGKISKSGEMIVCLPNLMIAQIVSEENE